MSQKVQFLRHGGGKSFADKDLKIIMPNLVFAIPLFRGDVQKTPVGSSWADRESYLSLVDGTFTHIRPRVQPFSMIGLGWLAYVRTDYRDSANIESHYLSWSYSQCFYSR
ncbi:hypothetical protein ACSQ6I_27130 [Anabaena sp. WFMT]|uniref:hypothetical protein n=1 Tax=Anabaena sp. WFMT TaxID=3449730 RepID=UPI003F22E9E8